MSDAIVSTFMSHMCTGGHCAQPNDLVQKTMGQDDSENVRED